MLFRWPLMWKSNHEQTVHRLTPPWVVVSIEPHPKGVLVHLRGVRTDTNGKRLQVVLDPNYTLLRQDIGRAVITIGDDEQLCEIVQEPMKTWAEESRTLARVANLSGDFYTPGDLLPVDTFEKERP